MHGTKVTVRDLFGKLPVRVKHRAIQYEYPENLDKEFEDLKRKIVALLLAWSRPVKIVLSDNEKKRKCLLRLNQESMSHGEWYSGADAKLPFQLNWICPLLVQAGCIVHSSFASWVTASARTSTTSIRAAISLEPAPTKQVQFFSFGIRPVDPMHGSQALLDEVNRMFTLSTFGAIVDDTEISEDEKTRRQNDKRYKSDQCTTQQLRGIAKGADRWPMFYIRIDSTSEHRMSGEGEAQNPGSEATRVLQKVLQLLRTLIYQFLEEHHFRPRARRKKRKKGGNKTAHMQNSFSDPATFLESNKIFLQSAGTITSVARATTQPNASILRRRVTGQGFDNWSRVKSGKPDGFEHVLSGLPRSKSLRNDPHPANAPAASSQSHISNVDIGRMALADSQLQPSLDRDVQLLLQDLQKGDFARDLDDEEIGNDVRLSLVSASDAPTTEEEDALRPDSLPMDETILWTNPTTGRVVHINSRTGLIVPDSQEQDDDHEMTEEQHSTGPFSEADIARGIKLARSLRPARKTVEPRMHVVPESWIGELLKHSENSLFRQLEETIPSVAQEEAITHGEVASCCHSKFGSEKLKQGSALFDARSEEATRGRLSKSRLAGAQVLAQVDRKFILVKINTGHTHAQIEDANSQPPPEETVLVLIDQHAADERCRVEALYAELVNVETVQMLKPVYFEVSTQEVRLFQLQKEFFAGWGFRYETQTGHAHGTPQVASSKPHGRLTSARSKDNCKIVVTALPNLIAERCRLDPKILINLLRSEVWARAENGFAKSTAGFSREESDFGRSDLEASGGDENQWLTKISACPKRLIEMLNSRACRSAIMFNDVLSIEECKALVKRLAKCSFPFQCAHGRPSMVALGGLGTVDTGDGQSLSRGTGQEDVKGGGDFARAFDSWQTNAWKGLVGR
jgi:DNA mismatch repair protein MLH3